MRLFSIGLSLVPLIASTLLVGGNAVQCGTPKLVCKQGAQETTDLELYFPEVAQKGIGKAARLQNCSITTATSGGQSSETLSWICCTVTDTTSCARR